MVDVISQHYCITLTARKNTPQLVLLNDLRVHVTQHMIATSRQSRVLNEQMGHIWTAHLLVSCMLSFLVYTYTHKLAQAQACNQKGSKPDSYV